MAGASALALTIAAGGAGATTFIYTGTIETFIAPTSGVYEIDLLGASGGAGFRGGGGLGAEVTGAITLSASESLSIVVGGGGGYGYSAAGGGGGSFVFGPLLCSRPQAAART